MRILYIDHHAAAPSAGGDCRALQLAQTHFADWTVRDAAHACNLSYSYFSRSFKQLFGIRFVRIWSGCGCLKANGCC